MLVQYLKLLSNLIHLRLKTTWPLKLNATRSERSLYSISNLMRHLIMKPILTILFLIPNLIDVKLKVWLQLEILYATLIELWKHLWSILKAPLLINYTALRLRFRISSSQLLFKVGIGPYNSGNLVNNMDIQLIKQIPSIVLQR
jgi:hypothetical protein